MGILPGERTGADGVFRFAHNNPPGSIQHYVSDHFNLLPQLLEDFTGWIAAGKVTSTQTADHGIENATVAFLKLFSGDNIGKMLGKL